MLINVIKTMKAASCEMGTKTKEYLQGETYDIHHSLAKIFIREAWGKEVLQENEPEEVKEEAKAIAETEDKAIKKSPENKSLAKRKILTRKKSK